MQKKYDYDAIIVGSGPNGLAAAITLAKAGLSVIVYEAKSTVGGGLRSAELTLPGFIHDICSAIHPLGIGSPFFQSLPLDQWGLQWIQPAAPLAHPFDDGTAAILERSIEKTGLTLGNDNKAYAKLMESFVGEWNLFSNDLLAPFHFPQHPILMARFGLKAILSAKSLANIQFQQMRAKALFAGLAAHSNMPLNKPLTSAFGLVLGILGHVYGWPMAKTGTQSIATALTNYFISLGGKVATGENVQSLDRLPSSKCVFVDISPKELLKIESNRLSSRYKQKLEAYRYGPGVCKIDWALHSPIPWKAKECLKAATVHLGGTAEEIYQSESDIGKGIHPEKPYIILAQQSLFDTTRAPHGKHTAWGYCHVPNGSSRDMTEAIENQIERFAPGFRDCILAKSITKATELEEYNPNCVGGDIGGGVQDIYQLFTRPVARLVPYETPYPGLYICSASTPPGGGVHGMCGYHAAKAALNKWFNVSH